jgi:hypothetical protein
MTAVPSLRFARIGHSDLYQERTMKTYPKAPRPVYQPHKRAPENSTVEWYTPPQIVEACGGPEGFDLDPCTPAHGRLPCRTARQCLTPVEDGLATPWHPADFVWLNPPYGRDIGKWMAKLANHPGGGVALVPANTDPRWAHDFVLRHPGATAVLFVQGRIRFIDEQGVAGKPASFGSMFVAYGERAARNVETMMAKGVVCGRYLRLCHPATFSGAAAGNDA